MALEPVRNGHHPLPYPTSIHGTAYLHVLGKSVVVVGSGSLLSAYIFSNLGVHAISLPFRTSALLQNHTITAVHSFILPPPSPSTHKTNTNANPRSSRPVIIILTSSPPPLPTSSRQKTEAPLGKTLKSPAAYLHVLGLNTPVALPRPSARGGAQRGAGRGVESWLRRSLTDRIGIPLDFRPLCVSCIPPSPSNSDASPTSKRDFGDPIIAVGSPLHNFRVFEIFRDDPTPQDKTSEAVPESKEISQLMVREIGQRSARYPLVEFLRLPSPPVCFALRYFQPRGSRIIRVAAAGCHNGALHIDVSALRSSEDTKLRAKMRPCVQTAQLEGPISFIHIFSNNFPPAGAESEIITSSPPPRSPIWVALNERYEAMKDTTENGGRRVCVQLLVGLAIGSCVIFRDVETVGLARCQELKGANKYDSVLSGAMADLDLDGEMEIYLGTYSGALLTFVRDDPACKKSEEISRNPNNIRRRDTSIEPLYTRQWAPYKLARGLQLRHPILEISIFNPYGSTSGEAGLVCASCALSVDIVRPRMRDSVKAVNKIISMLQEIADLEKKVLLVKEAKKYKPLRTIMLTDLQLGKHKVPGEEKIFRKMATESKVKILLRAVRDGELQIVQRLVRYAGDQTSGSPSLSDGYGNSALHYASYHNRQIIAEFLLKGSAPVNAINNIGATSLHFAAEMGHYRIVRMLIDSKAEVNATNINGWTALHMAAYSGKEKVFQLLVEAKANPEAKTQTGTTAQTLLSRVENKSLG
ncbi:hypothetical protein AAMO2058_001285800 [Amorphochlora amoebiformis]